MQAQAQQQAETQASEQAWQAEAALEVSQTVAAWLRQTTITNSTGAHVLNLTQVNPTTGEKAAVTKSTGA